MFSTACSGTADPAPTTQVPTTDEASPPITDAVIYPTGFEAELVENLVALEEANDYTWTIDNAVAAMELLRPVMKAGVDAPPPIDLSRLVYFLMENDAALTDEQRAIISAAPRPEINAELASYATADETRLASFRETIEEASREFQRRTGSVLESRILLLFSRFGLFAEGVVVSVTRNAEELNLGSLFVTDETYTAAWREYRDVTEDGTYACVVVVGEVFQGMSEDRILAGLMHEAAHCHQHQAHPGGPGAFFASPVPWMDEGYASWAGEMFVGGTAQSVKYWDRYHEGVGPVGGHRTTSGSYDGIAFFSYIHDNGIDGWQNFRRYFEQIRPFGSNPDKFETIFSELSLERQAVWAAGSLQRADLGDLWTYTTGPGVLGSRVARQPRQTDLGVGDIARVSLPNGEQGTYRIQPRLGGETAALLEVEISAPSAIRWPWGLDEVGTSGITGTWCLGEECVCEDGTVLGEPSPEFTESDAIIATFTGAGILTASLRTPEDECQDPEPEAETFGACPGGIWEADPLEAADLLLTQYRAFGLDAVTYERGSITMSFFESGTYRFDYNGTTVSASIAGESGSMELTGGAFGEWEASGSELSFTTEGFDISAIVTIDGFSAPTGNVPGGEGSGSAAYVCAGDTLLIDPDRENPFFPFPRTWTAVTP